MIHLKVQSGYNDEYYTIDTSDHDMAAKWLLAVALRYGPSQGGVYAPMIIHHASETKDPPFYIEE